MSTNVREIIDRITSLPDAERLELRAELARLEEQEWIQLSSQARQLARERGIDDATINQAIESLRYGSRR